MPYVYVQCYRAFPNVSHVLRGKAEFPIFDYKESSSLEELREHMRRNACEDDCCDAIFYKDDNKICHSDMEVIALYEGNVWRVVPSRDWPGVGEYFLDEYGNYLS